MPAVRFAALPPIDKRRRGAKATAATRLDQEDMARILVGFRGQPISITPAMRYVRASGDGEATAYVFDEESGMVYILD